MEKKRSKGIILFSILFLVSAIFNFIAPPQNTHWVVYPKMFTAVIFPSLMLLISIGLFILSKWGRILAILFALSKVLEWLWNIGVILWNTGCWYYWLCTNKVEEIPPNTLQHYISSAVMGLIVIILWLIPVYYLTRPKVREQFK